MIPHGFKVVQGFVHPQYHDMPTCFPLHMHIPQYIPIVYHLYIHCMPTCISICIKLSVAAASPGFRPHSHLPACRVHPLYFGYFVVYQKTHRCPKEQWIDSVCLGSEALGSMIEKGSSGGHHSPTLRLTCNQRNRFVTISEENRGLQVWF